MEKLLEKLGLKSDASEEEAIAKLETLQKEKSQLETEKSKLESDNKELTTSRDGFKVRAETLEESYKSLVENRKEEKVEKEENIFDELAKN